MEFVPKDCIKRAEIGGRPSCDVGRFYVDKRRRRPSFDESFNPFDTVDICGSNGPFG